MTAAKATALSIRYRSSIGDDRNRLKTCLISIDKPVFEFITLFTDKMLKDITDV
jgi:hypothetical protein